jgi:murein L,D-transpeptidase YcbB/YkuD
MPPLKAQGGVASRRDWLVAVMAAASASVLGAAARAQPLAPIPPPVRPARPPATPPPVALRPDQIALLVRTLGQSETHGFEAGEFDPPDLPARLQARDGATRQAAQSDLVAQTLRYAAAVHTGRLAPEAFLYQWGLRPDPFDPTPGFLQALAQDQLGSWLDGLPPPYTGYEALRPALAAYRAIAAKGGWPMLDEGPDLNLGDKGERVVALRQRLIVEDSTLAPGGPPVFDQALADAVTKARKRFGLEPTGVLDKDTLAALNVPASERVAQIIANMERWRWLPSTLPDDRIQVNIAAAILTLFHQGTPVLSMRAVTGRPNDQTPMLRSTISSIVLNPPWNVPDDIARKELWPKERAHPGYFKRNDFIVIKSPDGGVRLQQKAGEKSALGHVKFDFPSPYGVYLHDTPSHSTFGHTVRLVSHGCVRLEKPVVLANTLMQGSAQWTPQAIADAIAAGQTVRAMLPKPIALFLLYWTAFVGPDGQVNFRSDPYGWDQILMQRIDAATGPSA